MSTRSIRTSQQVHEWFADLQIGDRLRLWARACCSNPSPELYDDGNGNTYLKCMNCGA